jgi:precorrin-4 methylase
VPEDDWTDEVQRYLDAGAAKFRMELTLEQLAAWIVIARAANVMTDYWDREGRDDLASDVRRAIVVANESKPVRVS